MKIIDDMHYTDTHVYFWRNKAPFSNFYRRPFTYKGYALQFSEQGFMMEKAFLFDPSKVDAIARVTQPDKAKALGRAVQNYDDAVWSSVRYDKMVEVLKAKFTEPFMCDILLRTGDRIIVEASPYDRIWGVGLDVEDTRILDEKNWRGQNLLGKALMEVRDQLKSDEDAKREQTKAQTKEALQQFITHTKGE